MDKNVTMGKTVKLPQAKMKYIITRYGAILGGEMQSHRIMAMGQQRIYSAGFCYFNNGFNIICEGKSDSLNLESKPELDPLIISDMFLVISRLKYFAGTMDMDDYYKGHHVVDMELTFNKFNPSILTHNLTRKLI